MGHEGLRTLRDTPWIAPCKPLPRQSFKAGLWGFAIRNLGWVFIAQLIQLKLAAPRDQARCRKSAGIIVKQAAHLRQAAQPLFGIDLRMTSEINQTNAFANGAKDIHQTAAAGVMHHRRTRGHKRQG